MTKSNPYPKRRESEAKHKLGRVFKLETHMVTDNKVAKGLVSRFKSRFPNVVAIWRGKPTAPIAIHTPNGRQRVVVEARSRRHARKLAKGIPMDQWEVVTI